INRDTTDVFVPVTSFIHTVKFEKAKHNFLSNSNAPNGYYQDTYIDRENAIIGDSTLYWGIKNTFGIALSEGFNNYAKAGLTAFISHKISQYQLMNKNATTGRSHYSEQELYVGGELTKRQGNMIHYDAFAQVGMTGKAIGQFDLKGSLDLNFHLWNDTVSFLGQASVSNTLPSFYMRNYHSTHFWWDNVNSEKEFRTRIEGELNIERWNTHLKA
ncbi:hypothetical protein EZS27_042137, partial [termite gut metagenome]